VNTVIWRCLSICFVPAFIEGLSVGLFRVDPHAEQNVTPDAPKILALSILLVGGPCRSDYSWCPARPRNQGPESPSKLELMCTLTSVIVPTLSSSRARSTKTLSARWRTQEQDDDQALLEYQVVVRVRVFSVT
jgi:hypothetical protein